MYLIFSVKPFDPSVTAQVKRRLWENVAEQICLICLGCVHQYQVYEVVVCAEDLKQGGGLCQLQQTPVTTAALLHLFSCQTSFSFFGITLLSLCDGRCERISNEIYHKEKPYTV